MTLSFKLKDGVDTVAHPLVSMRVSIVPPPYHDFKEGVERDAILCPD